METEIKELEYEMKTKEFQKEQEKLALQLATEEAAARKRETARRESLRLSAMDIGLEEHDNSTSAQKQNNTITD